MEGMESERMVRAKEKRKKGRKNKGRKGLSC